MQEFFIRLWGRVINFDILAAGAAISLAGTTLFGEQFWAMVFLAYGLIAFDTLTRWLYICKKFIVDSRRVDEIINVKWQSAVWQFFKAETWNDNYLTSRGFSRITEKMIVYTLAIMVCFFAGKNVPEIHLFSFNLIPAQVFPGFISTVVFLIELTSVNENLILLGHASIADYCEKLRDFILRRLKV